MERILGNDGTLVHGRGTHIAAHISRLPFGRDRGQAPPELTGTVQRGNQNVPHARSGPPGYKVSLFCRCVRALGRLVTRVGAMTFAVVARRICDTPLARMSARQ